MGYGQHEPRLSVVIPAYNEAEYLGATLSSLQQQDTSTAYEVIVVDNGSTDDTAAVARAYGARVISEPQRGVCAARQAGTLAARGAIVVSTDADTVHPRDWLRRLEPPFADPDVVAVAGPCRYADPPWWAAVFPPLWFATVAAVSTLGAPPPYLTATNVAFRRKGFPGYDISLGMGGDEVDLLRRLRRWGRVRWDAGNVVHTSSRRMDQGLPHTVLVSYGYHYALAYLVNRAVGRPVLPPAPAVRRQQAEQARSRRWRWRLALGSAATAVTLARVRARPGRTR